jgi:hypothetical protein
MPDSLEKFTIEDDETLRAMTQMREWEETKAKWVEGEFGMDKVDNANEFSSSKLISCLKDLAAKSCGNVPPSS